MAAIVRKERCYIPSRESLKNRYRSRHNLRNQSGKKLVNIPDNSVPWGPHPMSVADLLDRSDAIAKHCDELRQTFFK
jgi:hypothetical protein